MFCLVIESLMKPIDTVPKEKRHRTRAAVRGGGVGCGGSTSRLPSRRPRVCDAPLRLAGALGFT